MNVTVMKTITENTNGRRRNPNSPTGWEERVGVERVVDDRGKFRSITIWAPCTAPLGPLAYGSEEHAASNLRGGTVRTVSTGVEEGDYFLLPEEAETLLRSYCREYSTGMNIFRGGKHFGSGRDNMLPHEGHAAAQKARGRVLDLFGLDLADTNLDAELPYRQEVPS